MEASFPQALFSTPGMVFVFVVMMILEALSFAAMTVILLAYGRVRRKQDALFNSLLNAPRGLRRHVILFWTYVLMTIAIAVISLSLFLFQPHLL